LPGCDIEKAVASGGRAWEEEYTPRGQNRKAKRQHKYDSRGGGAERGWKDKKKRDSQEHSKAPPSVAKEKRQRKCEKEKRRRWCVTQQAFHSRLPMPVKYKIRKENKTEQCKRKKTTENKKGRYSHEYIKKEEKEK
jgi:hypothetical protein